MFGPTESSRKYVDLIYKVSSKWANWDPPKRIEVGDYGTMNRKTGLFEKEGSIYSDEDIAQIAAKHPPKEAPKQDAIMIVSDSVKRREFNASVDIGIPELARASLKGEWQFSKTRGALLIMARPHTSYIPSDVVLKHLIHFPILADKFLVTDVVSCHAYCLYLSTKEMDVVNLALLGTLPTSGVLAATVSSDIKWWNNNVTGLLQSACAEEDSFSPLFTLKKLPKKRDILYRDSPVVDPTGDDLWVDALPPWDALDEDGNEVPFEDTIFYDDGDEEG